MHDGVDPTTRDRILVEASRLFARRGYYGSTTRDIAEAVGIRQPSLFHHFASKSAILIELVDADVRGSIAELERVRDEASDHAQQLHLYLARDTATFLAQPFDARGFYAQAVFVEPEFAEQRALIDRLHLLTRALVADGVAAGEFLPVDAEFVQRAMTALLLESMRERGSEPAVDSSRPLQLADFVLRAILVDRDRLDRIHAVSAGLLATAVR